MLLRLNHKGVAGAEVFWENVIHIKPGPQLKSTNEKVKLPLAFSSSLSNGTNSLHFTLYTVCLHIFYFILLLNPQPPPSSYTLVMVLTTGIGQEHDVINGDVALPLPGNS